MVGKAVAALFAAGILSTYSVYGGLELAPATAEVVEDDGTRYRELTFQKVDGKVALALPTGWTARAHGPRIQLTPADKSFAEATIEGAPLPAPAELDEATLAMFKQSVVATLPPGSQLVTTVSETPNGMMPGGHPTFEVVVSYQLMGKTFHRSALLVNCPKDRLAFRLTATKEDFDILSMEFRRSMMTWRFTEKKPPVGSPAGGTNPEPAVAVR